LEQIGQQDPSQAIAQVKTFLDAGAYQIIMESEGITENVTEMRTEVPAQFIDELGLENMTYSDARPSSRRAWVPKPPMKRSSIPSPLRSPTSVPQLRPAVSLESASAVTSVKFPLPSLA